VLAAGHGFLPKLAGRLGLIGRRNHAHCDAAFSVAAARRVWIPFR